MTQEFILELVSHTSEIGNHAMYIITSLEC